MPRYKILFKGRVQGVGFRYRARIIANDLFLTGNIKKLDNGNVECNIQGSKDKIDYFIEKLRDSLIINIEDYKIKKISAIEDEEGFFIK